MFSPVVRILFRQRKWTVSSPESCVFHKDNFNLNATYGVVILNDKSFAALQHFVQNIQVLRNIHHKGRVLHLLWDEILTLACICFIKFSISSRKLKKCALARHLVLAILNCTWQISIRVVPRTPKVSKWTSMELKVCFSRSSSVKRHHGRWTFACAYLFERSNRCEHAKGNMQKTGNFHVKKTEKSNKI